MQNPAGFSASRAGAKEEEEEEASDSGEAIDRHLAIEMGSCLPMSLRWGEIGLRSRGVGEKEQARIREEQVISLASIWEIES